MKYIRNFLLFLESVTNTNHLLKWIINYNHSKNHDLDLKIKRTGISNFDLTLNEIINRINDLSLNGSYTFISFKNKAKIVTHINIKSKNILIVTFLGVDEDIKNNDRIIIL